MKEKENIIHHAEGVIMGGPWQIRHLIEDGVDPKKVAEAAFQALEHVDKTMSHYKPESDLMRFSRAPLGEWFTVSPDLVKVMKAAAEMRDYTTGALNIALGEEINAWGFGAAPAAENPSLTKRQQAEKTYQYQEAPPALKRLENVSFNLSALAKGFAVDLAAAAVANLGVKNFLIEAAGEIKAQGERIENIPWQIGLELPVPNKTLIYGKIALHNIAVASSGGYRKYRKMADKTVIHTLDPTTGQPLESNLLAVTVLDPICMRADALATALFVKGAAKGSDFADKENIPALFLIRTEEGICEIRSRAWMAYLAETKQLDNE